MKESIITEVIVGENEKDLVIENYEDSLSFEIDGKILFQCDFDGNFLEVIERMLKIWKTE